MTTKTVKTVVGQIMTIDWQDTYVEVEIRQPGNGQAQDGGRYPEKFKGWDWDKRGLGVLERAEEGDTWTLIVEQSPKLNSNGNPYWNLIEARPGQSAPPAMEEEGESVSTPMGSVKDQLPDQGEPAKDANQQEEAYQRRERERQEGMARGVAYNTAKEIAFNCFAEFPDPFKETEAWHRAVRQLRDDLYHMGEIQSPVRPPHYCYSHEHQCVQSNTGVWGHMVEKVPCICYCYRCSDDAEEAPENPVEEPEPVEEELGF